MFNIKEEKKMRERKGGRHSRGMVKVAISLDDKRIDFWIDNSTLYDSFAYFGAIRREHENDGKEII